MRDNNIVKSITDNLAYGASLPFKLLSAAIKHPGKAIVVLLSSAAILESQMKVNAHPNDPRFSAEGNSIGMRVGGERNNMHLMFQPTVYPVSGPHVREVAPVVIDGLSNTGISGGINHGVSSNCDVSVSGQHSPSDTRGSVGITYRF